MTTRTYFWLLLVVVAIAPLVVLGFLTTRRAEHAASAEVQAGAARLAAVAGDRLGAYVEGERRLLRAIGGAALYAKSPAQAQAWLEASMLDHPHLRLVSVHGADGEHVAGERVPSRVSLARAAIARGLKVTPVLTLVRRRQGAGFSHTSVWAEPVVVVGERAGAIVARVDLVGLWPAVNAIRVGRTGFVRLLAVDGTLLAHGNPEERRYVFGKNHARQDAVSTDPGQLRVRRNVQGVAIVSASAPVPGTTWSVVVEQEVGEALRGTKQMKRDLGMLAAGAALLALLVGTLLGRRLVRELEGLRTHAERLARGELDARIAPAARLSEVTALVSSLNAMGGSLSQLQAEARARDRMATLARVGAGLAHDIRQPIETVRAVCAQLREKPDDAATRARFHRITERELPRLGDYVGDLQRMARGGDEPVRRERVDLAELCAHVVDEFAEAPKWRGVVFRAEGESSYVSADRRLVRRAVMNLASNGADACVQRGEAGEVVLHVSIREDGAVAVVRVRDTGQGIPEDRLAGLLDGDFETTKRSTGIGLGLGIVRHVAEVHGGRLEVESTPGAGTTFSLILKSSPEDVLGLQ